MTPDQFTYWLQGFVELHGDLPTEAQWQSVKDHLQQVFVKNTPECGLGTKQCDIPIDTTAIC